MHCFWKRDSVEIGGVGVWISFRQEDLLAFSGKRQVASIVDINRSTSMAGQTHTHGCSAVEFGSCLGVVKPWMRV